ncbi:hypothetical protein niasHT_012790 [Heterodera trifolii]|uniref:Secreted protein n=1 Tax=Heterodera trifolii TaxID=157864 RepID=A0ABD2L993_9BILA
MVLSFLLAFCLAVPIRFVDANFKCASDAAERNKLLPKCKTTMKNAPKENGKNDDTEVKEIVRDLFDHYNMVGKILFMDQSQPIDYRMIETVLYGGDQTKVSDLPKSNSNIDEIVNGIGKITLPKFDKKGKNDPSVKPTLMDKFKISKWIDQLDKPMADLIRNLHKSVNELSASINEDSLDQNAKIQNLKSLIKETVIGTANRLQISTNEIMPQADGQKIDQKSLLEELIKFWHKFKEQKRENGEQNCNSFLLTLKLCFYLKNNLFYIILFFAHEKREHQQRNKRILKLIINFTTDGVDGLVNLKSAKKNLRQRRRKKRSVGSTVGVLIVCVVLCILAIWATRKYCNSSENQQGGDIEAGTRVAAREIQPESPERLKPPRRHRSRDRNGAKERHRSRSNSQTRLNNLARTSSQGSGRGESNFTEQNYYDTPNRRRKDKPESPRASSYYGDGEK